MKNSRVTTLIAALLFVGLLVPGCSSSQSETPPQRKTESASQSRVPQEVPSTEPDQSLTVEEYMRLGMPRIDHPWTPTELAQATQVLIELKREHPRANSTRSGSVFARIVSPENLKVLDDESRPRSERFQIAVQFDRSMMDLISEYGSEYVVDLSNDTHPEIIRLMMVQIRIMGWKCRAILESQQSTTESSRFVEIVAGMQALLPEIIANYLREFEMAPTASSKDLGDYLKVLQEEIPDFISILEPEQCTPIFARLEQMIVDESLSEWDDGLRLLLENMKKKVAPKARVFGPSDR